MKVFIVRHGETEGNAQRIHQHGGTALSEKGLKQAKSVAERFKTIFIDHLLASPYTRAHQTAQEIAAVTHKTPEIIDNLREIKRPTEIEGKGLDSKEAIAVKTHMRNHREEADWHYSDEENFHEFKTRIQQFLSQLEKRPEKRIAIVTHGHVIRVLVGLMVFGEKFDADMFENFERHMYLKNTGITICELIGSSDWKVRTWNDYTHLED